MFEASKINEEYPVIHPANYNLTEFPQKGQYGCKKRLLEQFKAELTKKMPEINKRIMDNNFNSLHIKDYSKLIKILNTFGLKIYDMADYNLSNNTVTLRTPEPEFLYHELLHACSSAMTKEFKAYGFYQFDFKTRTEFGTGINEGYTELLTCRLYDEFTGGTYEYEKFIATVLEDIIGSDKMTKFYFDGDLYSLIKELSKYGPKEDIIEIFESLDYYYIRLELAEIEDPDAELINDMCIVKGIINDLYNHKILQSSSNKTAIKEKQEHYLNSFNNYIRELEALMTPEKSVTKMLTFKTK